ncbi:MAG: BlaI/MecI/CopY family transcriptional regulator [Merdibacter sp.]
MKVTRLTKRETDIMEIFWRSEKPLSFNDIHSLAPEISINTIQPNLRKLNERGYIEVAGVGFTRNSITREYQPLITQAEYLSAFLDEKTAYAIAVSYIEKCDDPQRLEELRKLLNNK